MSDFNDFDIPSDAGEPPDFSDSEAGTLDPAVDNVLLGDAPFDDVRTIQDTDVANFDASELTTTEEVGAYIEENIPSEHLEGLDSIEYVDDQKAHEQGLLGVWDPTGDTTHIEVYPHDDEGELYDTIAHEIGHNAEANLPAETVETWNDLYEASEQDEFVSNYAMSDPAEDFAETYSFYINDPEMVQSTCPDKYDFMKDNVFNGQMYRTDDPLPPADDLPEAPPDPDDSFTIHPQPGGIEYEPTPEGEPINVPNPEGTVPTPPEGWQPGGPEFGF